MLWVLFLYLSGRSSILTTHRRYIDQQQGEFPLCKSSDGKSEGELFADERHNSFRVGVNQTKSHGART
jgi:hypothetical protein